MSRKDYPRREEVIIARQRLLNCLRRARNEHPQFVEVVNDILQNKYSDYLGFSLTSFPKVSYAGKCHKWDGDKRTVTSLGRYIRRKVEYDFCDTELEAFVNSVISKASFDSRFELVNGRKIVSAYSDSIGQSSCMTGDDSRYTVMYQENPDKVSMLIYRDGYFTARALVWTCDDGHIVMDRIYPNGGTHILQFWEYAKKKGWAYRFDNSAPYGDVMLSDGRFHSITLTSENEIWPYMDTFRYATGDPKDCVVTNNARLYDEVLLSTCGGWGKHRGGLIHCSWCGEDYNPNEYDMTEIGGDYICAECLDECFRWSDYHNEWIAMDDAVFLHDWDDWVSYYWASNNAHYCEDCEEWFSDDEAGDTDQHGNDWYCENCWGASFSNCDRCDCVCRQDDMVDGELCQVCAEESEEEEAA